MILVYLVAALAADLPANPIEADGLRQLLTIRRVYVDRLTGGEAAAQMRDILISSLEGAKLFIVTENQERADAILRGASEDLVFTDQHSSSEGINAHVGIGSARNYNSSSSRGGNMGVGENESSHSTERRHEAIAAVRLVNKEGDVIWSTTQESTGGKFRGSSADVADKITKKLMEDFERAKKLPR